MTIRAVYPGTFDPVHYGHLDLMSRGVVLFDELVVVGNGDQAGYEEVLRVGVAGNAAEDGECSFGFYVL